MLTMISNFFKTVSQIFSVYSLSESFLILGNYLRIVIRNHWPILEPNKERILSYAVEFPNRPQFFGTLSEIFFLRHYSLPDREIHSIIDGGANIGLATLYFKWRHPQARVLCFEPNPEVIGFLKNNLARNKLSSVKVFPFALGKADGEVELFTNSHVKGSTSATIMAQIKIEESIKVPMRRLSGFITGPVDFLKLDVEGAEGQILEDLEEAGKLSLICDIVLEYHESLEPGGYSMGKLLSLLERNNFQCLSFPLFSDVDFAPPKGMHRYMVYAHQHDLKAVV